MKIVCPSCGVPNSTQVQGSKRICLICGYDSSMDKKLVYNLTVGTDNATQGTTDPVPDIYEEGNNDLVEVEAVPEESYVFSYWELDGEEETDNPIAVSMKLWKNRTLVAYFEAE